MEVNALQQMLFQVQATAGRSATPGEFGNVEASRAAGMVTVKMNGQKQTRGCAHRTRCFRGQGSGDAAGLGASGGNEASRRSTKNSRIR